MMAEERNNKAVGGGHDKLQKQAEAIRDNIRSRNHLTSRGTSSWMKGAVLLLALGTICGSVFLILAENSRQRLVEKVVAVWMPSPEPSDEQLFELPPPPPKSAEPVVKTEYSDTFSDEGYSGVLYADFELEDVESEEAEGPAEFVPPAKTEAAGQAFELLKASSEAVQQMVSGDLEDLEFQEWRSLQNKPPVFFIDLVVLDLSGQQELHMVWEVNVENESIKPLSQAARDFVAEK